MHWEPPVLQRGSEPRKLWKLPLEKKRKQSGDVSPQKRLVDKIAEGASIFLTGPVPSFATIGLKLAGQAAKGISDNVAHYRNTRRRR